MQWEMKIRVSKSQDNAHPSQIAHAFTSTTSLKDAVN